MQSRSSQDSDEVCKWQYLSFDTNIASHYPTDGDNADVPALRPLLRPQAWSKITKTWMLLLSCAATCFTVYAGGAYTVGIDQMVQEWGVSRVAVEVGVSTYTVGFAIAPMALAPFSELRGRHPVVIISGVLYVVFTLCTALTRYYAAMVVVRFLVGAAASTFSTVIGGVIAELYPAHERNVPMVIFSAAALLGLGLGPLISGFIAQNLEWRWIFYVQTIIIGVITVLILAFYRETRESTILQQRANELNKWVEKSQESGHNMVEKRIRWRTEADDEGRSIVRMLATSTTRPFHLLFTEPIVFFFSLWMSFAWSILYCTFSVIPFAFQQVYNFDLQISEAIFTSICVGVILAALLSTYQEKLAIHYFGSRFRANPEARLWFSCVEGVLLPIGLFWFGWTARQSVSWIGPALGMGCATLGIFAVYLAVSNYLADSYKEYASSAIAAQSFCRNMMAGAFPLFSRQMFQNLGFGTASSILGGIGAALALVPWVLVAFGPQIRARSKFATNIREEVVVSTQEDSPASDSKE